MATAAARRLTSDIELSHCHESLSLQPFTDLLRRPGRRTHDRRLRRDDHLVGVLLSAPKPAIAPAVEPTLTQPDPAAAFALLVRSGALPPAHPIRGWVQSGWSA